MIYPRLMTENMGEDSLDGLLLRNAETDKLARQIALIMLDEINFTVDRACRETYIGNSLIEQLRGYQPDCPTEQAVQKLTGLGNDLSVEQRKLYRELYSIMVRRQSLVAGTCHLMYRARIGFWFYFHVYHSLWHLLPPCWHISQPYWCIGNT